MATTLIELCELIVDSEHNTAPVADVGYPMIRTPNIGEGRFLMEGVRLVDDEIYTAWTRRAVPREGDLILAREAPVGNVAVIPPGMRPILGQRTVLIRPDREQVEPVYLQYLMLGRDIQHRMWSLSNGATVPHLNMKDIRGLEIPELPRLSDQRNIAAILAAYDELIENNLRRIKILEEMAQVVYREWFVEFRFPGHEDRVLVDSPLGPLPEGWSATAFGHIAAEVKAGVDPARVDPDVRYVGLEHVPQRSFTLTGHGFAPDVASRKWQFQKGDVLFGKLRPYFHKVARAGFNGICSTDIIVIRPRAGYDELALHVAFSGDFVAHAVSTSGGTDRPRAKWVDLANFELVLPEARIGEAFACHVRPMVDLAFNLARQNTNLQATRDLLLPRLVSGEIDVSGLDIDTDWLAS